MNDAVAYSCLVLVGLYVVARLGESKSIASRRLGGSFHDDDYLHLDSLALAARSSF